MLDNLFNRFKKRKTNPLKVSFLGLDHAGKTTIINWLKGRGFTDPARTMGIDISTDSEIEGLSLEGFRLTVWDIGGQETFRKSFWEQWGSDSDVLIYIIDANDRKRYPEAMSELYRAVSISKNKPLLYIIMNKLDLLDAVLVQVERDDEVEREVLVKKGEVLSIIDKNLIERYLDDILWELNLGSEFSKHVQAVQFFGTSAKTGLGLSEVFEDLLKKVVTFQATLKMDLEPLKYVPPMQSHLLKIQGIYIITIGGLTVLSAEFGSIEGDSMLVGGFLSALTDAAMHIFGSSGSSQDSSIFPLGAYSVYNRKFEENMRIFVVADRGTHKRALEKVADNAYNTTKELQVFIESQVSSSGMDAQQEFEWRMKKLIETVKIPKE
ncbi:MAG: ADP-ribosylation factor-like protein [Candidatus Hodarchaeales archaeon]